MFMDDPTKDGDLEMYPVLEKGGEIQPEEWVQNWWRAKLDKLLIGTWNFVSLDRMFPPTEFSNLEEEEEEEDLYG